MNNFLSRRDLLKLILSTATATGVSRAWGYPIQRLLGDGTPAFIRRVRREYHGWYCREFFDFEKALSKSERDYVSTCFATQTQWGLWVARNHIWEHVLYSHVDGPSGVRHGRLAVGPGLDRSAALVTARRVLRERRLQLARELEDHFFGLGWDFQAGTFKIYFHFVSADDVVDPDLTALNESSETFYPSRMAGYTYQGSKLVEKKLMLAHRDRATAPPSGLWPLAVQGVELRASGGRRETFLRTRTLDPRLFSQAFWEVARKQQREFNFAPDAVIHRPGGLSTIYYP